MDDSDSDEFLENMWSLRKRKKLQEKKELLSSNIVAQKISCTDSKKDQLIEQAKRFKNLKEKSSEIMLQSSIKCRKMEIRRSQKILKKVMKDPWLKVAVEDNAQSLSKEVEEDKRVEWKNIKPFLSINEHLHGPISHGHCGPKTELEHQIEDCIKEGDFEKAELLSDTLANREFAVKIAHAFEAEKYQEKLKKQKAFENEKAKKKLRWMFDSKERWQMKGNM